MASTLSASLPREDKGLIPNVQPVHKNIVSTREDTGRTAPNKLKALPGLYFC
jgi:hypothetical protein